MRLIILLAVLFAVNRSDPVDSNGDCNTAEYWYFSGTSCYKFYTTASSWTAAKSTCEGEVVGSTTENANLAKFSGLQESQNVYNLHNPMTTVVDGNGVKDYCDNNGGCSTAGSSATYWTAASAAGWEEGSDTTTFNDPDVLSCGFLCFANGAITCSGDPEVCLIQHPGNDEKLAWESATATWDWELDNGGSNIRGFICEYELTVCPGPNSAARIEWQSTAKDQIRESACPDGYTGTAARNCLANLNFGSVDSTGCAAVVPDGGWTNAADGALNDTTTEQYDNMDDGFGWSSDSAVTGTADGGVEYTKSFETDSLATDKTYVEVRIGVASAETSSGAGDWFAGSFTFTVDGDDVHNTRNGNSLDAEGTADVWIVIPVSSLNGTFEVGVTGTATSGSVYSFESMSVTPLTRQTMAEACYRQMAFNESTAYPLFEKADSGFLTAADDLTFTFTVPRELYDMEIFFEGQTSDNSNIGFTGDYSASLWETDEDSSMHNSEADSCGTETWTAAVPWTSMTGVFTSVESFAANSSVTIDNSGEDYYVFIATMNITAKEKIVAISDLSARTWTLVRTMHWKYPFALKWLRDISVSSELEVHVCTSAQTICTIRHVTAIISYIQTEVNPIADLAGQDGIHGTVTVGVKTLVAYPYMFVHDEDPQFNPDALDQITNSSLADYNYSSSVSGWLPEISYSPVENPDNAGTDLSVVTTVGFTFEDASSCTHNTAQSVNQQADAECEQNWAVVITPQSGSCFVDGNYTITWSARCFYDKPVCNFPANDAGNGYNNYVSSTLELKSTRMCPRLVQDVDLSGSLCSTGLAVEGADYLSACDADPTYIQGESTHFFAEISSTLAKIVKTEVTRIQYSQQYDFSGVAANLVPRYDDDLSTATSNDYNDLFVDGSATQLSFTDQDDVAVTWASGELTVVEDVQNSDACQQIDGAACTDAGFTAATTAGFRINLNALVFPAPSDGNSQVHFRTVLRTTYEGFENFDLSEGVLSGDTLGGTDDAQWCAPSLANDYASDSTLFCANHPSSADLATLCPSICGRRRRLFTKEFENRRHLQQEGFATPIEDDSQDSLFVATVNIQSAKAQVTGHINEDANQVDFTMSMIIDQDKLNDYNTQRPTFFEEMRYQLGTAVGALTEQFTVHSIQRVDHGNQPAIEVSVQIKKLDGLEDTQYLPSSIVKRLELLIQTGRLYDEDFFHLTAVYNMEYHENDETPHKVHFGEVDPVDTMPDDSVYTISLAFVCILFGLLW